MQSRQRYQKSELDRMAETRGKTGVFTGGYVINPMSGDRVPIWIADYVLPSYGTGAVMGVPAHDQRDFEFATKFGLAIKVVISPAGYAGGPIEAAHTGIGMLINSGAFDGLDNTVGTERITQALEENRQGKKMVQYRMHDWLISRQRYWGAPIPIVYCENSGEVAVPDELLPVILPDMDDFKPDGSGRSPLARLPEFVNKACLRDSHGMTFVFSTHDPRVVAHAVRVVTLVDGQLAADEDKPGEAPHVILPGIGKTPGPVGA